MVASDIKSAHTDHMLRFAIFIDSHPVDMTTLILVKFVKYFLRMRSSRLIVTESSAMNTTSRCDARALNALLSSVDCKFTMELSWSPSNDGNSLLRARALLRDALTELYMGHK